MISDRFSKTAKPRTYLVGMMGAGKSTVAKVLADHLEWNWMDTDACVERNFCMPVSQIFSTYGEAAFRKQESQCLHQMSKCRETIIAAGGGTTSHHGGMDLMLETGWVIYLKLRIASLAERLQMEASGRPLLHDLEMPLMTRLDQLLTEREPYYMRAHVSIDGDELTIEAVVQRILETVLK